MKHKLLKLAKSLEMIDPIAAYDIYKLAGRHDKVLIKTPIKMQPAYKYIMYLKLMRNLDDESFHKFKRKYLDTSNNLQREAKEELDKIIMADSLSIKLPSSTIRQEFSQKLSAFESDQALWDSYFNLSLGKR